jgi:hypothetical protein
MTRGQATCIPWRSSASSRRRNSRNPHWSPGFSNVRAMRSRRPRVRNRAGSLVSDEASGGRGGQGLALAAREALVSRLHIDPEGWRFRENAIPRAHRCVEKTRRTLRARVPRTGGSCTRATTCSGGSATDCPHSKRWATNTAPVSRTVAPRATSYPRSHSVTTDHETPAPVRRPLRRTCGSLPAL